MGFSPAVRALNTSLEAWLPPPGSERYYALLYTPPAQRRTLTLLEGLRSEITRVPATCSSAAIALPKLAWWREELGHLARGSPRHPLTQGLGDATPAPLVPAALALVSGVEAMLGAADWPTREARRAAVAAAQGPLWAVVLEICLGDETPPPQVTVLAHAVEEAWLLRDARRYLDGGVALVAHEMTTSAEVMKVPRSRPGDWHAAVMGADIALLEAELKTGLAALPQRRAVRPLATLTVLAIATLAEIRAAGSRVWDSRVELTPLRKLLLAWREARFAR